jgi:hypothetical protein
VLRFRALQPAPSMKCADSAFQSSFEGADCCSVPSFAVFIASSFRVGKDRFQMRKLSAGLLTFRRGKFGVEVFLVVHREVR